jgi:hypothetical protein
MRGGEALRQASNLTHLGGGVCENPTGGAITFWRSPSQLMPSQIAGYSPNPAAVTSCPCATARRV